MRFASLFISIYGIVFLIIGVIFWMFGRKPKKYDSTTEGMIVDMGYCASNFHTASDYRTSSRSKIHISVYSNNRNLMRYPIFEYEVKGRSYKSTANFAWNIGLIQKKMKQPITVYYNSSNPEEATVYLSNIFYILGKVFAPLGAILLIVALILFIMA